MTILDTIIAHKKEEVQHAKKQFPLSYWREQPFFSRQPFSLKNKMQAEPTSWGIIAEFKRKSPSRGVMPTAFSFSQILESYEKAGVAGVSILTDEKFFGGSIQDVQVARPLVQRPILRKEFIVDAYQLTEAKAIGADVILLIASVLDKEQLQEFTHVAHSLQLEVLLELNDEREWEKCADVPADFLGVNNRNLKTLSVEMENSDKWLSLLPREAIKISESGISSADEVIRLKKMGYQGFLIGHHFIENENPPYTVQHFMQTLHAHS